jgi:hypothetical protein
MGIFIIPRFSVQNVHLDYDVSFQLFNINWFTRFIDNFFGINKDIELRELFLKVLKTFKPICPKLQRWQEFSAKSNLIGIIKHFIHHVLSLRVVLRVGYHLSDEI